MTKLFGQLTSNKNHMKVIDIFNDIYDKALIKDNLAAAAEQIISILAQHYRFSYCSLFTYNSGRKNLNIAYSTVPKDYAQEMLHYSEYMYTEMIEKGEQFKIRCTKDAGEYLDHPGAIERNIRHIFYIIMKSSKNTIGTLLIESKDIKDTGCYEQEHFKLVIKNITIAMQTLLNMQRLISLGNIDGHTQVFNKTYFLKYLQEQIDDSIKYGKLFSIAIFDIDHFKKINDNHGHLFGDKVLKDLAALVKKNIRDSEDLLARYGGEEFVLFLAGVKEEQIYDKLDCLRQKIAEMNVLKDNGEVVHISASFGVSDINDSRTVTDLIDCADKALYRSKRSGRNQVRLYRE